MLVPWRLNEETSNVVSVSARTLFVQLQRSLTDFLSFSRRALTLGETLNIVEAKQYVNDLNYREMM